MRLQAITATGSRRPLTLDTAGGKIGAGGEGTVYQDPDDARKVAKIFFKPTPETADKITAMIEAPPPNVSFTRQATGETLPQIAWPEEILVDDATGGFAGYSMAKLADGTSGLHALFAPQTRQKYGLHDANTMSTRLYIARNLSAIVSFIHQAGHRMLDLKPNNLQLYKEGGFLCLLDCDGFSIRGRGNSWHHARVITREYLAPECVGLPTHQMTAEQDLFGLAVILFKLLANNLHPSDGKPLSASVPSSREDKIERRLFYFDPNQNLIEPPPTSTFEFLEDDTQELFCRAFLDRPQDRPSAREWVDHIETLIAAKVACTLNPHHDHFSKGCGLCFLDSLRGGGSASAPPAPVRGASAAQASQSATGSGGFTGIHPTWAPSTSASSPPRTKPASATFKATPTTGSASNLLSKLIATVVNLFRRSTPAPSRKLRRALYGVAGLAVVGVAIPKAIVALQDHALCRTVGVLCPDLSTLSSPPMVSPRPEPSAPPPAPEVIQPQAPPGSPSPVPTPPPAGPTAQTSAREQQYFEQARDLGSVGVAAGYEAYLVRYPDGAYADQARQEISRINAGGE